MDHNSQGDGDLVIDIESCRATNEEVGSRAPFSNEKLGRSFSAEVSGGLINVDVSVDCENGMINVTNGSEGSPDKVNVLIKNDLGVKPEDLIASRTRNERRKSNGAKKPPKPPRPPRGYSLDAADHKLIKEITELAMLKRARIERMKALEKMKAAKASSVSNSRGSFVAMFFSVLFFLVIVFHGMSCSNSSTTQFHGSPEAPGSLENLIMVQHQKGFSSNEIYSTASESPNLVEQISGSDHAIKLSKASG
ncbi:hypothetical protein LIER_18090 [Lithospermum erythrorhizon]|uniref:Transmembrane protein n=1 Tax=Lithospermum erythrorhizon TaxID=34254 RepID=A0AAV3QCP9_LITER